MFWIVRRAYFSVRCCLCFFMVIDLSTLGVFAFECVGYAVGCLLWCCGL